jgi:hypothetical protein
MLLNLQYKIFDVVTIQIYNHYKTRVKHILWLFKYIFYYLCIGMAILSILMIHKIIYFINQWIISIEKEIEEYPESKLYNLE